jgi:tetratricopeptide (TPR) repeat protein
VSLWTRALEAYPEMQEARVNRAAALAMEGRHEEAWQDFASALEQRPDSTQLLWNIGALYFNWGRPRQAIPYFKRYLAAGGAALEAYLSLGEANELLKDPGAARKWYRKALAVAPNDTRAERGLLRSTLGPSLKRLEADAYDADALFAAAGVYERIGNLERAVELLQRLVERPTAHRAESYYRLGRMFLSRRAFKDGRAYLRAALRVDPQHDAARRLLQR